MRNYVIALYIRLSVEDFKTESLSIPNQKLILREKAMSLPEWDNSEILEFIDNGHTGTNFERPAVQELLTMVQAGKINCIIVKDLSRFGRNSIETGYFIERVFPLYHTRFISVSDDFDTANFKGDTGGIDIAFKYLISECYSRDMSMKTKSAKYAKMRRGEYQSVIRINWICRQSSRPNMKKNSVLFKTASGIFMSSMHSERLIWKPIEHEKGFMTRNWYKPKMFMLSLLHRQSR